MQIVTVAHRVHRCYCGSQGKDHGVTNHFWLDLRLTSQKEMHAWYCTFGQELMVGELVGPKAKPTTVILLQGYSIKLLSKFISTYP